MAPPTVTYTKTFVATDSELTVLFYNFDINSAVLKPAHLQYLTTTVTTYLSKHLVATVIGLTSRTGSDAYNMGLSKLRAEAVARAIKGLDASFSVVAGEVAAGEEAARIAGVPDKTEDGWWRGVLILLQDPSKVKPTKPTGRFYDRLWIYDVTEDAFRQMESANDRPNTYMLPLQGRKDTGGAGPTLAAWFDVLVSNKMTFGSAIFITHGSSGILRVDGDDLGVQQIDWYFKGKGHEQLFPKSDCKLYFAGCNVADGDAGWKFLEAAGAVFLRQAGGLSYGWTSLGFAAPSFLRGIGGHAVHLWGDVRYVEIGPGGKKVNQYEVDSEATAQQIKDAKEGKPGLSVQ